MANTIKTSIDDLDSAIRSLEISTNPKLRRACNCQAARHPLLAAAPNCLSCGKIICVKEGLGPCTFCGKPLLSSEDTQTMIRMLREERGREKMEANNAAHRRADVSKSARGFTSFSTSTSAASPSVPSTLTSTSATATSSPLAAAEKHRDKLLSFQETSARRTKIIDEAADFETPSAGLSIWATPQERAMQLKRQQKMLRRQEWQAKPEYEKRSVVLAIDLAGRKVTKSMGNVAAPPESDDDDDHEDDHDEDTKSRPSRQDPHQGRFSRNPLLGNLIRPTYPPANKPGRDDTAEHDAGADATGTWQAQAQTQGQPQAQSSAAGSREQSSWRRVQDDLDDNEHVILDGGVYGQRPEVDR